MSKNPKRMPERKSGHASVARRTADPPSTRHAPAAASPAKDYEPTPAESKAVEAYRAAREERPAVPRLTAVDKNGVDLVTPDHPDLHTGVILLMQAMGTLSSDFALSMITQLANAGSKGGKVDECALNFMLSVVTGIEARDQQEAMLAAQMAATHMQVMTFARRLTHVENIPQQDSAERAYNKLCRTFAAQIEALRRYRNGGEQTVRVEHVTVNQGGQAIVGNVTPGGAAPKKPEATP
jgi:hypothetical protein